MLIGFDAKRAFTNTSGLGNYSRFVISSLAKIYPQDSYILYTPRVNNQFKDFYPKNAQVTITQPKGWQKKVGSLWRVLGLSSRLKQDHIDIYHGLSNELPVNIKSSGVKTVVTIHDLIFLRFPELYKPIDRAIYKYKFKSACQQADIVVAISEQTKQDLIDFFGIPSEKIKVIYQDCDAVFHEPTSEGFKIEVAEKYNLPSNYILSVGTHEPRKNQLNLLKAWHTSASALDLVFVGKQTAYTDQLIAYIEQEKLNQRVHFLPYIQFQELPAIYQMAHIFAYPSLFEGFGIPIVEALNSGVPVITSSGSCFKEAGGEAAMYVSPDKDQVMNLAVAIQQLSGNSAHREEMIRKGYQHALLFRPERTIKQLHKLYKSLL
jgi:glycosyltransferase involved in cell wall biosynthesis